MRALDTSAAAQEAQIEVWRRMGGTRKLLLSLELSEATREMSRAGIRARHQDYDATQVEHALRRMVLGDQLFRAAWPDAPLLDP